MTYTEFIKEIENNIAKANCNKLNIGEYEEKQKQIYKQIRADIIDELYNKIDEGVCDICEHKDFESDCFKTCKFEVENAKKWLLSLKEQNK